MELQRLLLALELFNLYTILFALHMQLLLQRLHHFITCPRCLLQSHRRRRMQDTL